ncbi:MAG: threonylcarbamoyl-AMP synthase [Clostridia bacterium]|nr:threonylcarbamoyl-AMP synthase [Clostridia bacterium]
MRKYEIKGEKLLSKVICVKTREDFKKLDAAAHALKCGKLVAFPTETVYGLGANALDEEAVRSIFKAKGRPQDNPLIVHIAKKEDIKRLVKSVPDTAKKILDTLTPGPITIILEKSDIVPSVVTAGGKTVAVRIPESEIARKLIEKAGVPVAAPSANTSGKPSPTKAEHVIEDLADKLEFIIDGGACRVGLESTVLDLTVTPPAILRPGGVTHEELCALLGEVKGYKKYEDDKTAPKSPGMKYRHYAPSADMTVFCGELCREEIKKEINAKKCERIYVLTAGDFRYENAENINCGKTPEEYSKNLFDALRSADNSGAQVIFAEFPFSSGGIATALFNRISKSCGGNIKLCK